jgi:hypothetical protein
LKVFQEWGRGRIKENEGGGEFNCDIFGIRTSACHSVPLAQQLKEKNTLLGD